MALIRRSCFSTLLLLLCTTASAQNNPIDFWPTQTGNGFLSSATPPSSAESIIGSSDSSDSNANSSPAVSSWVFVIIALSIAIVLGVWAILFRRKRRRSLNRLTGREAGVVSSFRGVGPWLDGRRQHGHSPSVHEEGLNVRGEAPPPYEPDVEMNDPNKPPEYQSTWRQVDLTRPEASHYPVGTPIRQQSYHFTLPRRLPGDDSSLGMPIQPQTGSTTDANSITLPEAESVSH